MVELELLTRELDARSGAADADVIDLRAEANRPAGGTDVVGERRGDSAVVGDRGRRRVKPRDGTRVRLDLAQRASLEPAELGNAVLAAAPLELTQPLDLAHFEGDDELA